MDDVPLWSGEFTMGSGHAKDGQAPRPTVADVLPSLFLDASCYEAAGDLLEFCSDLGLDIDTQKGRKDAQRTWQSCRKAARDLREDFTDREYATLSQLSSMI